MTAADMLLTERLRCFDNSTYVSFLFLSSTQAFKVSEASNLRQPCVHPN